MAGGLQDDNDEVIASINMVPFIDISLVLLIIFLVTSSIIVRQSIDVDLPRAASGAESAPSTVAVVLTAEGELFFNGEPTTESELATLIRREADNDEQLRAIISADRGVDYGAVVDLIDIVKLNGAAAFALNIERDEALRGARSGSEPAAESGESEEGGTPSESGGEAGITQQEDER